MEDEAEAPQPTLPAVEGLQVIPRTVVPAGESEVVAMLAEQARFNDNDEMRDVAKQLWVRVIPWRRHRGDSAFAPPLSGAGRRNQTLSRQYRQATNDAKTSWAKASRRQQRQR